VTSWDEAENVLCVRLDSLGDVLMTTPALRALKDSNPRRRLTLLTSPSGAAVAALIPEVDGVITYEAPWMKIARPDVERDRELIDLLAARRFDAAIIFTVATQSALPAALICYLAGIPLRAAYCRENPYHLLTDRLPERDLSAQHEVERQLALAASLGYCTENEFLSLAIPDAARIEAEEALRATGLDEERPWVLIHPGASAPSRRYPPLLFAAAADLAAEELGWSVVFSGSAGEQGLVEEIRGRMTAPSLSVAGALELPAFAAVVEAAPLLISNNTGPVHIAAAVGTPVVDIYALTNLQHAPWRVPHRLLTHDVPCRGCLKSVCPVQGHPCLSGISPREVVDAAADLMRESRPEGRRLHAAV